MFVLAFERDTHPLFYILRRVCRQAHAYLILMLKKDSQELPHTQTNNVWTCTFKRVGTDTHCKDKQVGTEIHTIDIM